jgi:hypothetical protein
MEVTKQIRRSFADEHVIGVDPPMRPELPGVWRRRINPFAGRAVSDKALTAEQDVRSGMQRIQGLALAPGTVEGLELTLDPGAKGKKPADAFFQVGSGLGLARSGEDVSIGSARRMSFGSLQTILRADHEDRLDGEGAPLPEAPAAAEADETHEGSMAARLRPALPRRLGRSLAEIAANPESAAIPHVAVLLAQPVTATILGRPVDDCPPDPRDEPYADLQRIDGCRLALYLWPSEMAAIDGGPDYALPAADGALRNRLAYAVFDNEKLLLDGEMHPWEEYGVPLAVVAFDADWNLLFADRFAVARTGGTPHARTQIVPMTGDSRLWQARIDQFVGHLTDLSSLDQESLHDVFVRMPPVGLLPPDAFDPVQRRQHFFPGTFGVSAVPVPFSNVDLAIREAAALASYNRSIPDRVELLVPVEDSVYDPHLLEVEEEDPRFGQAVADFRADRAEWLSRREAGRRRYDRLMESVSGQALSWPGRDLPMEENSPAPRVQVPVETTRTRRFDEQSALRTHSLSGAHSTLPVARSDSLFVWLRIHSASNLTGLSLRVGSATNGKSDGPYGAGVYWGAPDVMPISGEPTNLAARKVGELPEAGIWNRLEVPADRAWTSGGQGLEGFAVNAVEFSQRGGQVEWGSFGKIDAAGNVYTYVGDDAPAGAVLRVSGQQGQPAWPWAAVAGREDLQVPDFGTVEDAGVRRVAAIDAFRADWTQSFLAKDMDSIDESGIGAFLTDVQGRLKATNDAIDLGFVRARSDIYRVRQIMLGADAASRLVTSPSLADLAMRDEGARATSRGISDFLLQSVDRGLDPIVKIGPPPPPPPPPPPAGQPAAVKAAVSSTVLSSATMLNITAVSSPRFSMLSSASAIGAASFVSQPLFEARAPLFPSPPPPPPPSAPLSGLPARIAATVIQPATLSSAISVNVARFAFDGAAYRPRDIQAQAPVAGLVERTVSVAERLTPSPAVQALNYAIASKAAVIAALAGLADGANGRPRGVALGDLLMPGYEKKRADKVKEPLVVPTLDLLLADRLKPLGQQDYVDSDQIPDSTGKHESDYFTAAVSAIDNSVAIMRLVEGRVSLFQALNDSLCDLRDQILASANEAASWLRHVDIEIEEARHDMAVAERLRAEEQARIDATNARRSAVLAGVSAILWRRVREADNRRLAPVLEIGSGLAISPVVACRRDHDDVPDEIHDYVELLRDAPAKWFPAVEGEIERVDRIEAARAAIEAARIRASIPLYYYVPPIQLSYMGRFQASVYNAVMAQRRLVEERRAMVAQLNLQALNTLSLAQVHIQLRESACLGDFIDGRHRQPLLTRLASEEMEGIGQVAGCLHASFGEVAPVIRLGWAELLSEFDRPAPLQSLAGLPGWPEVPMELRRTLQGFVDWLFHRIDRNNEKAKSALNELVRIAMLMAAEAPVDRIIPAQLVAPAPAKVGNRFQLALDISRVRKGMTTLIRDRDDRIVARALVDDVIDGHVSAIIVQNHAAIPTVTHEMRFHLVSGAM